MPPLLKNFLKSTLLGFAVGAALAFVLQPIAEITSAGADKALGEMVNPLWTGSFFAAINGATTLASPVVDHLFGDKSPLTESPAPAQEKEPAVTLYLNQEPQQGKHCARLDDERTKNSAEVARC